MLNRRHFLQSLPVLGSMAAAPAAPAPEDPGGRVYLKPDFLAEWNGQIGFALDPPVKEWEPAETRSGQQLAYAGGGYRLELIFDRTEAHLLSFAIHLEREDRRPFTVRSYSVKAQISLVGIYRMWDYRSGPIELMDQFHMYTRGLASGAGFAERYGANSGIPIVLCTDREGRNRFALGMLDQVEATGLRIADYSLGRSARGEGLNFSFEFVRPLGYQFSRVRLTDGVWIDTRPTDWFASIGRYSKWVETNGKIAVLHPPAAAYEPIWNTWYPFGQNINEKIIMENAEFCRKVGIPTLCIDAGYNNALTTGMANAADIEAFNRHTGDWTADPRKFPDFRGLVERLHQQGQKVTVWVALFIVGKETRAYPGARHMLMRDASGKELIHLCPRHSGTPAYLARTFLKLAKDYDLDGFWLDFMDGLHLPCYTDHPHATPSTGEGYNRCLAAVRDALLGWKPGFLIETRMKMSNLNVKQFANVLETTDMPFDFDLNRSLGVVVRSFSAGSAAKLDPAQWHIQESDANVAKSCATVTLAGVPVFGVDFRLLPESHLRVIAAWMQYYRQFQQELTQGRFEPNGFAPLFPQFSIRSGSKAFLYVGSSSVAPVRVDRCNEVHVVNASDSGRVALLLDGLAEGQWSAVVRDCYLEQALAQEVTVSGHAYLLDQQIPEGGMLILKRT
ncbi:MAG TPA: TIM-barrel domain-containing protein [Bryobacteraceae bacterium]|nr:TIM-barrel domain-containing protein [Bryobacteraceae bacterium]